MKEEKEEEKKKKKKKKEKNICSRECLRSGNGVKTLACCRIFGVCSLRDNEPVKRYVSIVELPEHVALLSAVWLFELIQRQPWRSLPCSHA
jgi:hypothetical protein